MSSPSAQPTGTQFDRIAATSAALVVVALAVFLLVRSQPIADSRLFFVLRVALSFSTATLGATIPGFLNIRWSWQWSGSSRRRCACAVRADLRLHAGSCPGKTTNHDQRSRRCCRPVDDRRLNRDHQYQ